MKIEARQDVRQTPEGAYELTVTMNGPERLVSLAAAGVSEPLERLFTDLAHAKYQEEDVLRSTMALAGTIAQALRKIEADIVAT